MSGYASFTNHQTKSYKHWPSYHAASSRSSKSPHLQSAKIQKLKGGIGGGLHQAARNEPAVSDIKVAVADASPRQHVFEDEKQLTTHTPALPERFMHTCPAVLRDDNEEEMAWDVLGIGQSMVDFSASVDDKFLDQLGIEKGGRRIIDVQERARILELLSGSAYEIRAGGSLANTLSNLGRLGRAEQTLCQDIAEPLKIGAISISGDDYLGLFHQSEQTKAGVQTLSSALPSSSTGTVIVLTTPDANRTFLSYLGTSQELCVDTSVRSHVRRSRMLLIEGYVWEMPNAAASISQVMKVAHQAGATVGMTAGDANVIRRHRSEIWTAVQSGVDVFFANKAEAQALLDSDCTAERAALQLGPFCDMAIVTDGANGSCISAMGHLQVVPPFWAASKPVDTCGAGDGYAAGLIYGWLSNMDPTSMGRSGARVASSVIAKTGPCLSLEEAHDLIASVPVETSRMSAQHVAPS